MESDLVFNYCHDPEIRSAAVRLGIGDTSIVNHAFSMGERPYTSQDYAEQFLREERARIMANRLPKSALSKKQKEAIFAKHGLDY